MAPHLRTNSLRPTAEPVELERLRLLFLSHVPRESVFRSRQRVFTCSRVSPLFPPPRSLSLDCQNHGHFSGRPEAAHSLYGHTAAGVSLTCRQFAFQISQAWPLDLQQPQAGSQVCSPTSGPKYRSRPSSTQNLSASQFP